MVRYAKSSRRIPVRDLSDMLDVHVPVRKVFPPVQEPDCPLKHCSDYADNYICYTNYEDCPFYRAYRR